MTESVFERHAVDITISGDVEETYNFFQTEDVSHNYEFSSDLMSFYSPEEIASRQERWQKEDGDDEIDDDYDDELDPATEAFFLRELAQLSGSPDFDAHNPTAPSGYQETKNGVFVRESAKVGRNDPYPCGSGKKYKKCCGNE